VRVKDGVGSGVGLRGAVGDEGRWGCEQEEAVSLRRRGSEWVARGGRAYDDGGRVGRERLVVELRRWGGSSASY